MKLRQYAEGNFLPIIQHEIVEVVVPAKSSLTRIQFPDIQNLRDSNLVAIEFYQGVWGEKSEIPYPNSLGIQNDFSSELVSVTPTGKYLCPQQIAKNSYLTLQAYNGVEFLHQSPILTHRYTNGISPLVADKNENTTSELMIHQFSGQKCNWPKCYIERFDNYKGVIEYEFSYLFSIYYYKSNEITTLMGSEFRKQS